MAHITKALAAGNVKRFFFYVLVFVIWAAVVQLWLRNYGSPGRGWLLIPLLVLLWDMTMEDYDCQTVDIRKTAALGFLIFHFSAQSSQLLAFRLISGCIVFLAFYIGALHYSPKDTDQKTYSQECIFPLSFLPSFAFSLLLGSICYLAGYVPDTSLLPELDACLVALWALVPKTVCIGVAFFVGWYLFHWFRYLWHKERREAVNEGIGFGDVIFLPLFVAFFGWAEFSLIYTSALLIHIIRYMIFRCVARKGEG